MSKYYTPKIEEFYIGFEFESNYVLFNNTGSEEWKQIIMSEDEFEWFHSAYRQDACSTEFRVKYLDKEDIKSLGFTIKEIKEDDEKHLEIYYKDIGVGTFFNNGFKDYNIEFYNVFFMIKNKSELKKLMEQLNITNE